MASTRAVVLLALLALTAVASARTLATEGSRRSQTKPNQRSSKGPVVLSRSQPNPLKLGITKPDLPKPTVAKPTKPTAAKPTKPSKVVKPAVTKPTTSKPSLAPISKPSKSVNTTMPKHNTTVMFSLLNKTEQACVDKIFNLTSIKTLKPYQQCGGRGANCTAFGAESTHCLDAPFYNWDCPTNYTCARQGDNEFYRQCVPINMTAMTAMKMGAMNMSMNMDMSKNSSEPVIITGFNKTIAWVKLPQMVQDKVSKCLGWPMSSVKTLKSYDMCGGMAPQQCDKYGKPSEVCKDKEFPGYQCPMGEECKRQSMWFWQCEPKM